MRPMSVREMDALCYERGVEFDPADVPLGLAELAHGAPVVESDRHDPTWVRARTAG
jgi:hypothetical protein